MKGLSGPVVEGKKRRKKWVCLVVRDETYVPENVEEIFLRLLSEFATKRRIKKRGGKISDGWWYWNQGPLNWIECFHQSNVCMDVWMNEWMGGVFIAVPERWEIERRVVQVWNLSHIEQDLNTTLTEGVIQKLSLFLFSFFSLFLGSLYAVWEIIEGSLEEKLAIMIHICKRISQSHLSVANGRRLKENFLELRGGADCFHVI